MQNGKADQILGMIVLKVRIFSSSLNWPYSLVGQNTRFVILKPWFESEWGLKKYLNDYGEANNLSWSWNTINIVYSFPNIKVMWCYNLVLVVGFQSYIDTYSIYFGNSTYNRNNGICKREIM